MLHLRSDAEFIYDNRYVLTSDKINAGVNPYYMVFNLDDICEDNIVIKNKLEADNIKFI